MRVRGWYSFVFTAVLAFVTMGVSMNLGSRREHRAETVALQQAILRGEPGACWRWRSWLR